jgi:3D (Asp-Asp-Asp) domain-containing protein
MSISFKCPEWGKSLLIFTLGFSGLWLVFSLKDVEAQELAKAVEPEAVQEIIEESENLPIAEGNSLIASSEHADTPTNDADVIEAKPKAESEPVKKVDVLVTAYSSTLAETDDTPFTTASGTTVRDGVVANNLLPFGTRIRIPGIFGDKVFTVEDRMHWRKPGYQVDIWFPNTNQAVNFGVRSAYIEIIN